MTFDDASRQVTDTVVEVICPHSLRGGGGSIATVPRAAEGFGYNPPQSVISQVGCTAARIGLRGLGGDNLMLFCC